MINWNNNLTKPESLVQNPNLNHLVESSFKGVNRLFVLASEDDAQRTSYKRYHLPNVQIKDYIVIIDGKICFDQPVKNNKTKYEKTRKIANGQGDGYTTVCLLDYAYNYKMISIVINKKH